MKNDQLQLLKCKRFPSLSFLIRPGTSDPKAIEEVVEQNGYQRPRKNFVIEPGEEWVDLGANIGAFSILAAHLGAKKISAFEADPNSFELLKENIKLNGFEKIIEAHHFAVIADRQKKAWLSVSEKNKNFWRNSIAKQWQGSRMIQVPCVHFSETFFPDRCVKMDIEGSEMPILEKLDFATKKLVFEWSFDIDKSCERFRAVVQRLEKNFSSVDYSPIPSQVMEWPGEWFPAAKMVWCQQPRIESSGPK